MAKQTIIEAGDLLPEDKLNQLWGLNSFEITYNADGTIASVEDLTTSVVYTINYNADGTIDSIEDDDNTWTLNYNTDGTIAGITRT